MTAPIHEPSHPRGAERERAQAAAGPGYSALSIHGRHVGVAGPGSGPFRDRRVDPFEVRLREVHLDGADILFEILAPLRPRDWDDVVPLAQEPCECELPRGHPFLHRNCADALDEFLVPREIVRLEPRKGPAEVVGVEPVRRPNRSGEESTAQGAEGDEPDAEFSHRGQDLPFRVTRPERILGLESRDWMDRVRSPDRLRRSLREAEISNLALVNEIGHRADRLLDRRPRVDSVEIVEVDVVDAEPLERCLARPPDMCRAAVYASVAWFIGANEAEFRGQYDILAAARDRPADELLVGEGTIHIGGIEEVHSELQRAMDRLDRLDLVGLSVDFRHAHAAQADLGDFRTLPPQPACLHESWTSVTKVRRRPSLGKRLTPPARSAGGISHINDARSRPKSPGGGWTCRTTTDRAPCSSGPGIESLRSSRRRSAPARKRTTSTITCTFRACTRTLSRSTGT